MDNKTKEYKKELRNATAEELAHKFEYMGFDSYYRPFNDLVWDEIKKRLKKLEKI